MKIFWENNFIENIENGFENIGNIFGENALEIITPIHGHSYILGYIAIATKVHVTDYTIEPTTDRSYIQGYVAVAAKVHVTAGSQRPHDYAAEMKLLHSYIGRSLPM